MCRTLMAGWLCSPSQRRLARWPCMTVTGAGTEELELSPAVVSSRLALFECRQSRDSGPGRIPISSAIKAWHTHTYRHLGHAPQNLYKRHVPALRHVRDSQCVMENSA